MTLDSFQWPSNNNNNKNEPSWLVQDSGKVTRQFNVDSFRNSCGCFLSGTVLGKTVPIKLAKTTRTIHADVAEFDSLSIAYCLAKTFNLSSAHCTKNVFFKRSGNRKKYHMGVWLCLYLYTFFLFQPSGRRSNGSRATSGQLRERDRRRGQTQVHGLGLAPSETPHAPLRKIEEDALPKVDGVGYVLKV